MIMVEHKWISGSSFLFGKTLPRLTFQIHTKASHGPPPGKGSFLPCRPSHTRNDSPLWGFDGCPRP